MADFPRSENPEEGERVEIGRYRYIRVSADMFIYFMKNGMIMDRICNPLPPDTRYIRMGYDDLGTCLMVIESKEFELLRDGDAIPFYGHLVYERANLIGDKEKKN